VRKLAIEAGLPIVSATTGDVLNFKKVVAHLVGKTPTPFNECGLTIAVYKNAIRSLKAKGYVRVEQHLLHDKAISWITLGILGLAVFGSLQCVVTEGANPPSHAVKGTPNHKGARPATQVTP
jgi:hypothetical protein